MKLIKRWKTKLHIRDLITQENLTEEQLEERSCQIGQRLRQFITKEPKFFSTIPYGKLEFEDIAETFEEGITDINYFNEELQNLWDWCDEYRVWVPFVQDKN